MIDFAFENAGFAGATDAFEAGAQHWGADAAHGVENGLVAGHSHGDSHPGEHQVKRAVFTFAFAGFGGESSQVQRTAGPRRTGPFHGC